MNNLNKCQLFIWKISSWSRIMKKYYKGFINLKFKTFTLNLCIVILCSNEMREHLGCLYGWDDTHWTWCSSYCRREMIRYWCLILQKDEGKRLIFERSSNILFCLSYHLANERGFFCPLDKIWKRKGMVIYGNICI